MSRYHSRRHHQPSLCRVQIPTAATTLIIRIISIPTPPSASFLQSITMKPVRLRAWTRYAIPAIALLCLFFVFRPATVALPPSERHEEKLKQSKALKSLSDQNRTAVLEAAIRKWDFGPAPDDVLIAAGACTPRDATDAVLRAGINGGVVDVGANKGWPVTKLAVKYQVEWILSVEPDERNYVQLKQLTGVNAVQGAVSSESGSMDMAFHKDRDDFTCFDCLNKSRDEVEVKKVRIYTADELIGEKKVGLFKTDTQGHEAEVVKGGKGALRGADAVIMEFDPKLLRKWENAEAAVGGIIDGGVRCVGLSFAGGDRFEWFGKEVRKDNLAEFWDFVKRVDMYTDLLCLRR